MVRRPSPKRPDMAKILPPKSKTSRPTEDRKPNTVRKTKKQICIDLLKRPKGASLAELQKVTGWQPHSVRGFLSGTVKKLEGVALVSEVTDGGKRQYRITRSDKTV